MLDMSNLDFVNMSDEQYLDTVRTRLEENSIPVTETGCWIWEASLHNTGYGKMRYRGKKVTAHRISYMVYKGEIPKDMFVLHSCDVRECINPNHLRLGDHIDNMSDMSSRNRTRNQTGTTRYLDREQVLDVREKFASGEYRQIDLARMYNVHDCVIRQIVQGKTYKDIQ